MGQEEVVDFMATGVPLVHERHWRGTLCKSGLQYCELWAVRQDSSACYYDHGPYEPFGWPDKLDVTKRADFKSVKSSFLATPPNQVGYSELLNLILELEKENNNGKPACDSTCCNLLWIGSTDIVFVLCSVRSASYSLHLNNMKGYALLFQASTLS
jgi:hypothetical protein